MNVRKLLSYVLASTVALSSSSAVEKNVGNKLLKGQYKANVIPRKMRLKKNKIRKVGTSKAYLNSDKSVLKSGKRDKVGIKNYIKKEQKLKEVKIDSKKIVNLNFASDRSYIEKEAEKKEIKIASQKIVNLNSGKSFQVNAESLKENKVDGGKSFKDKLLLGGEITLGILAALGLSEWAFDVYCKKCFNQLTFALNELNGIYELKRTYKDKKGETRVTYNYFCFLYNSYGNYAACSSNKEALLTIVLRLR